MNELLNNINNHTLNNNVGVCYDLTNYIITNKIENTNALKELEDKKYNISSLSERNKHNYLLYVSDKTHLDDADNILLSKLVKLEDRFESSQDENEKAICLIIIYSLIKWEMPYPYLTYKLILEDSMK